MRPGYRYQSQYAAAWNNKEVALDASGKTTEANAAFAKTKELRYMDRSYAWQYV